MKIITSAFFNVWGAWMHLFHVKTSVLVGLPSNICCGRGEDFTVQEGTVTHNGSVVLTIRRQYQGSNICERKRKMSSAAFQNWEYKRGPCVILFSSKSERFRHFVGTSLPFGRSCTEQVRSQKRH